jgi:hypothetical protein
MLFNVEGKLRDRVTNINDQPPFEFKGKIKCHFS